MGKMEEGVGNAPTSAGADPVFKTGAASLYLPAFQKWSGWPESHALAVQARPALAGVTVACQRAPGHPLRDSNGPHNLRR